MSNTTFASARHFAMTKETAKAYLTKRRKDYRKFTSEFNFEVNENDKLIISFSNGNKATFLEKGGIVFVIKTPGASTQFSFDSYEQFCAFYLAKFW